MQFGQSELAAGDSPIANQISYLNGEYGVLMASIVAKDWVQCGETVKRCRSAYDDLFKFPPEMLIIYASDIQKLQEINKQTLEFMDGMREQTVQELAQLRHGKLVQEEYSKSQSK